jgi:hypothetical protein
MLDHAASEFLDDFHDLFDLSDLGYVSVLLQCLYVIVFVWFLVAVIWRQPRKAPSRRSVAVLVLGDVGRSPRMMYHAGSFAKSGFETFVVGYEGMWIVVTESTYLIRYRRKTRCRTLDGTQGPVPLSGRTSPNFTVPAIHPCGPDQDHTSSSIHPLHILLRDPHSSRVHHCSGILP